MKTFEALMDAIKERHIPEKLELTSMIVSFPKDKSPDEIEKIWKEAVKKCLETEFEKDEELRHLYFEYCIEVSLDNIVKELNIQPNESITKLEKAVEAFMNALKGE